MIRKKNNRTLESTQQENLPEGWIYAKLPDIVTNNRYSIKRGPFGSHLKKECFVKSGYKVYEQQNAINNDCELGTYYINEKKFQEMKAFEVNSGDLLISCSGTIGKITLVPKIFQKGIINQALLKISINSKIMQISFFSYLFEFLTKKAEVKSHGSGIGNLFSVKVLKEIPILLPPLNEQKRIIVKIESIFSQIDAMQKRLEMLSSQIKSVSGSLSVLKNSILKQAFEGKLMPQDPNDEPAGILLKKINSDPDRIIFEKKNIPKGWVKTKLNNICELIGGGTPSRQKPEYFNGDIIWLTPTEIPKHKIIRINNSREKITELGLKKSSAKIIPINSVLLTSRASIGYVAIAGTEVTTNQGFASFVCNKTTSPYFLAYWLFGNKNLLESKSSETTFKEISKSKLRELEFKLPPLPEQHRIVSKIESIFVKIDADFIKKRIIELIHNYDYLT